MKVWETALLGFLIWLAGAVSGAIALGILMDRHLDAMAGEIIRTRHICHETTERCRIKRGALPRCAIE